MDSSEQQLAIIGGGITGLTAAYEAVSRGATQVHVYESAARLRGKIESGQLNGTTINRGAEFIDSEHAVLRGLCQAMDVPLVENRGMAQECFQRPNGALMSSEDFYAAYKPYAEQIILDRAELTSNPTSERAQTIRQQSLADYLAHLQKTVPPAPRSIWDAVKDTALLRGHASATALAIASNIYAAEAGQPTGNISAAQFIAETSPTTDSFLASDCKYRVEGGTEALITRLRAWLAAQGVVFHMESPIARLDKQADGKIALGFANGAPATAYDRTILALPTYALAKVQGLDALGLSQPSLAWLDSNQYTNSIKFTVATQPNVAAPEGAFYGRGFQSWSPASGLVTFLVNAETLGHGQTPKQLLTGVMESYAASHGSSVDRMFDVRQLNFTNPGSAACYATPTPAQLAAVSHFSAELPTLANNGIGIAGTFLPHQGGYGFMECGVVSAKQSIDMLLAPEKTAEAPRMKQWAPDIAAARTAANDPSHSIAATR